MFPEKTILWKSYVQMTWNDQMTAKKKMYSANTSCHHDHRIPLLPAPQPGGSFLLYEDQRYMMSLPNDPTRWCPSSLAKLVQISPISLWFMAEITIVFMGFIKFINPLITGGHHPAVIIVLSTTITGWWCNFTILKNDGVRQLEGWHPIYEMETQINVWNHQPDKLCRVCPSIVSAIVLSIIKSYSRKWIQTLPEKILYHLDQIPVIIPMEVQLCHAVSIGTTALN